MSIAPAAPDVAPQISSVVVSAFDENCYVVVDPTTGAAAIVDPGDEGERIIEAVRATGARLEGVWLTHGHLDHIGALADVLAAWNVPVHMHALDLPVFRLAPEAARRYGVPWSPQPEPTHELTDGQVLELGALRFTVMHTPGHAPGHVVLHGHGIALAGDLLFQGSVGRTDLEFADPRAMSRSLARIVELPNATLVYPGHGPSTTIDRERRLNPFLNGGARVLGG